MLANDFIGTACCRYEHAGFALGSWMATRTGEAVREHFHPLAHFMFISGGRFLSGAGSRATPRSPLIYNPAGTVHRDRFESTEGRFFAVSVAPEIVDELRSIRPACPQELGNVASHAIVARLIGESGSWDDDSPDIAEALCFELLATLSLTRSERVQPRWLEKATSILREPHATPLSLARLSRELGIHRTHFTRAFRELHGCTPAEFARLHRLRRAAAMLEETRMPLSDVALEAGFADQSHFTRHFRNAYGVSPGQYRRLAA